MFIYSFIYYNYFRKLASFGDWETKTKNLLDCEVFNFMLTFKEQLVEAHGEGCHVSATFFPQLQLKISEDDLKLAQNIWE